jgi:hypothetical protein
MGQKKEIFFMSYLYVKWNGSAVVCPPTVPPLKHVLGSLTTPAMEAVGKECIGVYQPTGFSEDGGIVVKAGPYFDVGEDQPDADSCLAKEGVWLIGPADDAIRQLSDNYKPKHYGKEAARERAQ